MRPAGFGWIGWLLAGALLAAGGSLLIALRAYDEQRARFETDARIVHRVLSQRVVQHDAILATLALLQPALEGRDAPEQRLTALYPQVLRVLRRTGSEPWSGVTVAEAAALAAAETASRGAARPALGPVELPRGRYWLVRAAEPSSYALQIDLAALPPVGEGPVAAPAAAAVALAHGGQRFVLQPGRSADAADAADTAGGAAAPASAAGASAWLAGPRLAFAKALAAESQPFEVRVGERLPWAQWPWAWMLAWSVLSALAVGTAAAWLRQRAEQRRTRELLRLGQVSRLNAMGELAAGIAHELNQPLTAVVASTAAARRLLADEGTEALPQARDAMTQAAQQARRAADVLARLRRLVEPAGGSGGPQATVPLATLLEAALDLRQPELDRAAVRASVRCDPPDLRVSADAVALEQIVHNLIGNAAQALQQVPAAERRLELVAAAEGARGVVTVRDSGPGIAPEALPRLFEPFFTTREGGLGLGLSLCETLAGGMGGRLSGGNAPGGRGAVFRLELPRAGGSETADAAR
ncbi:MAG: two-component sensor histidine kinase [Rubrivivax sp.]|nr:two-component sensor histidine kinase [Rubrivivax sp.]